jgi:hypothetical protein
MNCDILEFTTQVYARLTGRWALGILSLATGLNPFVTTVPTAGAVGANVIILGNNLTGTTKVSFNLKAAAFTVLSETEITATVPASATTGSVEVVTPGGTLASNHAFRVLK